VSREGPGIILDSKKFQNFEQNDPFVSPALQDLVIMECHVRDLLNKVPGLADSERLGFAGLTRWLRSKDCYLADLGVNAVELQPLQDFDSVSSEEYHWGYMPINYFCPARNYATQPEKVSQIVELQDCVKAFHERGIAVIVDVVYNHVGDPKPLLCIDKRYYFHCMPEGKLTNWSGCGNDLRTQSPMVRRLILDSLLYWVKTFHVDGFRFDLAELLGKELLCEIERELRKVRPGIILIAEPWSFRAHMGISLKDTEFSVWNDGYRDFVAQYVCEKGNSAGIQYFLGGSIKHLTRFPTQTINYTESHDDRCWIDKMTERSHNRGDAWTKLDRQRTHLMFSILFASLGIPMIAAGQDFLKSKHGVSNTYQNGALNALDYLQIFQCPSTHDYVKNWIAFRKSLIGGLLRLDKRPSDGYLTFFEVPGKSSIGALFNADHSLGPQQILYAVNPHHQAVSLHLPGINPANFTQIADHEHFSPTTPFPWTAGALHLPPVSCGLWTRVL
jgi:pullulanase/glycogen debranching enzyme